MKTEGDYCSEFVLLLSGEKRIYKRSVSGREITLYEMGAGDICVLNASCILSNTRLPANADSLSDVRMLLVPAPEFLRMMQEHHTLRTFVFRQISHGFVSAMSLISEIVFRKLDERLVNYLVEKSADGVLEATHRGIADDLGTSREVISRLLKDFERQGMVSLSRSCITVDRATLRRRRRH